ncbi:UDP-N-acetylenolpyruvoylglucosamine reductase [Prosthecochloris marina]|uniref:UDP-N-acetylenolpyruvoylglucosamine reductase n=1 Tax=Prosthecochloris marina TaxID=2017681 RepID=A0A317T3S8_9CHLB|nr:MULTISPECIES: UDP-N-acetylmuramate dehydrogenase [Prosthecochloris]PWW81254.1 UDP-N-acetylenolpyruvoylglucosamine reductase [Prosthecochloris marina]
MISTEELLDAIKGRVLLGESMKEHTALKVGGSADFYVDPLDRDDLCRALSFFEERNLPYTLIGRGTNLVVHDDGIRGAVIVTSRALGNYTIKKNILTCSAGVPLPVIAEKTFSLSLGGLEMLQGIPGTIGGAVAMNAGAYGQEMSGVVSWVEIFENGKPRVISAEDIRFGYRYSSLGESVILGSGMKLEKLSTAEHGRRSQLRREAFEKRALSQPLSWPNAGSVFRNPRPEENPSGLSAGQMIDACGLKGTCKGGAMISQEHANIIINTGEAASADVMELICLAKEHVRKMFGVSLELEVKLLGYEKTLC